MPTSIGLSKNQGNFRKNIYFCFTDYTKAFAWITTNCGKFLKRWEYQTTYLSPEKPEFRSRSNKLEPYMEQTGSKLGKEYSKAIYCHPVYLTSMESTSHDIPSWMNHKLESRLSGEISTTSDMQMVYNGRK